MTHLKLVTPAQPPKPPRAMRRVRALLADIAKSAETRRFTECIVVTMDKDGLITIGNTTGDTATLIGMLEIAKQDILETQYPLDVE